jgi:hypothetical protein
LARAENDRKRRTKNIVAQLRLDYATEKTKGSPSCHVPDPESQYPQAGDKNYPDLKRKRLHNENTGQHSKKQELIPESQDAIQVTHSPSASRPSPPKADMVTSRLQQSNGATYPMDFVPQVSNQSRTHGNRTIVEPVNAQSGRPPAQAPDEGTSETSATDVGIPMAESKDDRRANLLAAFRQTSSFLPTVNCPRGSIIGRSFWNAEQDEFRQLCSRLFVGEADALKRTYAFVEGSDRFTHSTVNMRLRAIMGLIQWPKMTQEQLVQNFDRIEQSVGANLSGMRTMRRRAFSEAFAKTVALLLEQSVVNMLPLDVDVKELPKYMTPANIDLLRKHAVEKVSFERQMKLKRLDKFLSKRDGVST